MKKVILSLIILLYSSTLFINSALAADKKNEKTEIFTVEMDCISCVKKIEGNIAFEKGVKDLKVSLENKECTITYRTDKTSSEKIIEAFKKLGYKAEVKVNKEKEKGK